MRKVFFCGKIVRICETNQIIGHVYLTNETGTEIVLCNGEHQWIYWGTKDKKGNFIPFCSNFKKCNKSCIGQANQKEVCFYSNENTKDVGMYVNTQNLKNVY